MDNGVRETFIATAAFGLEGVAAGELRRMGIPAKAEPGGARFEATLADAFRANLWLRSADRVMLVLAEREATSFEALFQLVNGIAWERYLPRDARFPVRGKCVRSQLMSVSDCQAIAKKAAVERLRAAYRTQFLPETGDLYPVDVSLHGNVARVSLDMSGDALNRRGYRVLNGDAALRETLAASLLLLSPWRPDMTLCDPCCGTGTLLIEAAMIATNTAPGLARAFTCERFAFMPAADMARLRAEAAAAVRRSEGALPIFGGDIDGAALSYCDTHIRKAGFEGAIAVRKEDLRALKLDAERGFFIANPPYGERLGDLESARALSRALGDLLRRHSGFGMGVITADPAFERYFRRRADQKRRLYNGRIECEYCVFLSEPAPRRKTRR